MAINTQKLLPPSKISLPMANFSGFSIQKKTTEVNRVTELSKKYNQQNLNIVKSSLIDVDSLLKSVLSESKSTEETKRRRKEREEYEERESRLEIPKEQKKFRLPAVSLPGMSFLDRIKRFLFFTALGWLFSNFQSQLPKLLGIVKIITLIYGVVENVFKFILSSVVNFVERGYETYDKIRALVKSVGGENAQQDFDALSSKMNEYINYILIGGMALTGAISAFATNVSKFKPQQPTPRPTGGGPKVTTGSGGRPPSTAARVTTSGGRLAQRQIAKNFIRTSVKPVLSRLPIVGGLIEFGLSWALGDPVGKAAFRGIGSLLVGAVGTAIGGPIGAAIGGILGGEVGGKVYDVFFGGKKPAAYQKGGRIRAYQKGGSVLGDYGSGRTLEVERTKKPTPPPQTTQPGQDVGGQKEIKKLFPNPNENILTYNKPNPYYALTGAASDFKSAPYGLGSLMGGAIDVALGQQMSNTTIINASRGLENMFYDNYDRERNTIDVQSIIQGVVKSAASSAFENIRIQVNKGKKKEEEKPKPTDQTQTAIRDQVSPQGVPGGVDVGGEVVGYVGSTGRSSGPHIHIETGDGYSGKGGSIPDYILSNIIVGGKPLSQYPKGDGLGAGRGHQGFDFPAGNGSSIVLKGGLKFVEYDEGYNAGYGNSLIISDSSGRKYLIGHLSGGPSNPNKIKELQEKQKTASVGKLDDTSASKMAEPSAPIGSGKIADIQRQALNIISRPESGGDYNAMNRGQAGDSPGGSKKWLGKNLTDMTIGEVLELQKSKLWAAGRYQFVPNTLPGVVRSAGLTAKDRFNTTNQDLMAISLIKERGIQPWTVGGSRYSDKEIAIIEQARKAQKGGIASNISSDGNYVLPKQSPTDTSSLEHYASYAEGGGATRVAIQRVVIEKMIPIPMEGKSKSNFMIAGGVNSPDMSAFQS